MTSKTRQQRSRVKLTSPEHEALVEDKPHEDAQKSYHTVLEQHVQQATEDLERPASGLLLSSFSAGLDLGFGPFLMAVIATVTQASVSEPLREILLALAYGTGFIFVVVGRSALFTEQTTSAVLPVLAHRTGVGRLLRLWMLVLAGNLVGSAIIAAFIAMVGPALGAVDAKVFAEIASKLLNHPWWIILVSATAAGWLMGLLSWLVVASRETTSQIIIVAITTFIIGIAGLHHSIAGSIEVLMAVFSNAGPTLGEYAVFAGLAVVGNAFGGAVFVALLKFGHVRASVQGPSAL